MMRPLCLLLLPAMLLGGCGDFHNPFATQDSRSGFRNPFSDPRPFVATPVPADFSIAIDENAIGPAGREHAQRIVTAVDASCRTTRTVYNEAGSATDRFVHVTPLSAAQLQVLWNAVGSSGMLDKTAGGGPSDEEILRQNSVVVRVQAGGQSQIHRSVSGGPDTLAPLVKLVKGMEAGSAGAATSPATRP